MAHENGVAGYGSRLLLVVRKYWDHGLHWHPRDASPTGRTLFEYLARTVSLGSRFQDSVAAKVQEKADTQRVGLG